jgi:hypothetical protein
MNYQKKYLKYREKYIKLKNLIGGGRAYEEMPKNITLTNYAVLPEDEKIFYDSSKIKIDVSPLGFEVKYLSKLEKEIVDRLLAAKRADAVEKERRRTLRNIQIRETPGITITVDEYRALPADKYGFEWIPKDDGSIYHEINRYVKGRSFADIEAARIDRQRQIRDTPRITITVDEYRALPADKYGFEWIPKDDGSFYHETVGYTKGRSLSEVRAQAETLEREKSEIIKKTRITYLEYNKLDYKQQRLYRPVDGLTALQLRSEQHDYIKI